MDISESVAPHDDNSKSMYQLDPSSVSHDQAANINIMKQGLN